MQNEELPDAARTGQFFRTRFAIFHFALNILHFAFPICEFVWPIA
jgi:hypothetical protein